VWEKRSAELFFIKDPHLNPEGNRAMAERIHEGLRK
jgi:lysophospholipase L1-like esterase